MTTISSDRFEALIDPPVLPQSERLTALEQTLRHLKQIRADDREALAATTPEEVAASRGHLRAWLSLMLVSVPPFIAIGCLLDHFPWMSLAVLLVGCAVIPLLQRRTEQVMGMRSVIIVASIAGTAALMAGIAVLIDQVLPGVIGPACTGMAVIALAASLACLALGLGQDLISHPVESLLAWIIVLAAAMLPLSQGLS